MNRNKTRLFGVLAVVLLLFLTATPVINSTSTNPTEKNNKARGLIEKIRSWIENSPFSFFLKRHFQIEKTPDSKDQTVNAFDELVQKVLNKEKQDNPYNDMKRRPYYPGAPRLDDVSYYAPDRVVVGFKSYVNVRKYQGEKFEGFDVVDIIPILHVIVVKIVDMDPDDFINQVEKKSEVSYAELDGVCYPAWVPNDEHWDKQWGLKAINCPKAWDIQKNEIMANIIVCDSGIDRSHEDLDLSYFSGIDYVNDDNNPNDDTGHGTNCTGIILARTNNGKGIAGVPAGSGNWGYLTSVKVLGKSRNYNSVLAKGIVYGLITEMTYFNTIISVSIESYENFAPTLRLACELAVANGCLIVAAAGNNGANKIATPGRFDTTVCVGAVEWKGDSNNNGKPDPNEIKRCDFSPYGNEIDIVAPGRNIYTTVKGGIYDYAKDGTSTATAFVSGVAALYFSKHNGDKSAALCKAKLFTTATDLGEKGKDEYYGHGLVNAYEAIKEPKSYNLNIGLKGE